MPSLLSRLQGLNPRPLKYPACPIERTPDSPNYSYPNCDIFCINCSVSRCLSCFHFAVLKNGFFWAPDFICFDIDDIIFQEFEDELESTLVVESICITCWTNPHLWDPKYTIYSKTRRYAEHHYFGNKTAVERVCAGLLAVRDYITFEDHFKPTIKYVYEILSTEESLPSSSDSD